MIVGYGDLGQAVGERLLDEGMAVNGLSRSGRSHNSAVMLTGDVTRPESLAGLRDCDPEILLYCVAASEQSDDNYRAHYVEGLRNVLQALDHARRLRHVFFVSSTRVYGQKTEALPLSGDEERLETLIQYFRLQSGLEKTAYARRFGRDVNEDFGEAIAGLVRRGLLEENETVIRPTAEGFYLNNEIGLALIG